MTPSDAMTFAMEMGEGAFCVQVNVVIPSVIDIDENMLLVRS